MVFVHFPSNNTDEEVMLQAKYSKLRKKKKALEQMKVTKPEPEKVNKLKRPLDPKDAKELARKLIQSGKVALPMRHSEEKTVFKRPRMLERKILATGRSEGHGGLTPGYNANYASPDIQFEPFTPAPMGGSERESGFGSSPGSDVGSLSASSSPSKTPTSSRPSSSPMSLESPQHQFLSSTKLKSAASSSPSLNGNSKSNAPAKGPPMKDLSSESGGGSERSSPTKGQTKPPKRGPTIYVSAHNITDEILRTQFGKFGKIVNIKLNNPSVGFITFDKVECAELAVQEMNGSRVDDISYSTVEFSRKQPNIIQQINDAPASASWTAIATSHSQKSSHQDKRQQVVYDELPL